MLVYFTVIVLLGAACGCYGTLGQLTLATSRCATPSTFAVYPSYSGAMLHMLLWYSAIRKKVDLHDNTLFITETNEYLQENKPPCHI